MSFFRVPQAYAQCNTGEGSLKLEECLTLEGGAKVSDVFATPADMINLLVRNLFVVGGVLLFITLIYAGFLFIQGGSKGKDQARDVITTALIGMIVMFAAYWIVRIISLITGGSDLGV
jgi:RsiW-degrading membrane proteinase PrsW (M82 family)